MGKHKNKTMKTLKEELQEILDEKKIKSGSMHICNLLVEPYNVLEFESYFEMSKKYAPKMHTHNLTHIFGWWNWDISSPNHLIREKYRFIKDLIEIL